MIDAFVTLFSSLSLGLRPSSYHESKKEIWKYPSTGIQPLSLLRTQSTKVLSLYWLRWIYIRDVVYAVMSSHGLYSPRFPNSLFIVFPAFSSYTPARLVSQYDQDNSTFIYPAFSVGFCLRTIKTIPFSYIPLSLSVLVSGRSRQLSRDSEQRSDGRGQRWPGRLLRPGHRQRRHPQQER